MESEPTVQVIDGVVTLATSQQVVEEQFTDLGEVDQEISDINAAVLDIDNFRQRRLDNLNARLSILQAAKALIGRES